MKQNISLYYLVTLLAILGLTGVKYVEPFISGDITHLVHDWTKLRTDLDKDMGIELWFPMLSAVFFVLCTMMITISIQLRIVVFIFALINLMYVVSISYILGNYILIPYYRMDNGYFLHVFACVALQLLAINSLRSVDRKSKKKDEELLDELI